MSAVDVDEDTAPEMLLRRALHARGLRFRVDFGALAGRPDIVFTSALLIVVVDGDFWHGRDLEARLTRLGNGHNAPYWSQKIRTHAERDVRVTETESSAGWQVLRICESDLKRNFSTLVDDIETNVRIRSIPSRRRHRTLEPE